MPPPITPQHVYPGLRMAERELLIKRGLLAPWHTEPLTPAPWLTHSGRRMRKGVVVEQGQPRTTLRLLGTEKFWEPEHPAFAQYCYEGNTWEDPYAGTGA